MELTGKTTRSGLGVAPAAFLIISRACLRLAIGGVCRGMGTVRSIMRVRTILVGPNLSELDESEIEGFERWG